VHHAFFGAPARSIEVGGPRGGGARRRARERLFVHYAVLASR
jgi:hypothetical protein